MRRGLLLLLSLPMLFLAGCNDVQTEGGLRRPKTYKSIVSLSPSTTEIVASQGDRRILKGITSSDNYPVNLTGIPIVASVKPEFEKIAGIKPDLIVYDSSLYGQADIDKLKGLGAETFMIDATTVDAFIDQLYRLGSLLGTETNMSSYVDRIRASRAAAQGNPPSPSPKVAVLLAGTGGEDMIAGVKSFLADVVKVAGGLPIGPQSDKFERMSPEYLVAQNPDVIIVASMPQSVQKDVAAVHNDPRLASVKAVKSNDTVPVNQDVVVRRGARVDKLIDALHAVFAKAVKK